MNDCDKVFRDTCLDSSPITCYLIDSATYPKDLCTTLDRVLAKHNEDSSRYLESTSRSSIISLSQDVLASIVSDEFYHDE